MAIGYLGTYTHCQTLSSGQPNFKSQSIYIFNPNGNGMQTAQVKLQTRANNTCLIHVQSRQYIQLNIEVTSVLNYDGCYITFFE